jgi:hypothetical protein
MKAIRLFFINIFLIVNITTIAQNNKTQNFDKRVQLSILILDEQPIGNDLKNNLPDGFILDSINTTGYYLRYMDNIQIVAYLYKDTERIVAIGFYEKNDAKKDIYEYTEKEMKYVYTASEHMCDYYNKGNSSIRFCPNMKEGLMVYIEKIK